MSFCSCMTLPVSSRQSISHSRQRDKENRENRHKLGHGSGPFPRVVGMSLLLERAAALKEKRPDEYLIRPLTLLW